MNAPQPEGHMASYIERRKFLATLLGGAAAWPLAARAQQSERMRRISVLMNRTSDSVDGQARFAAFRQTLQDLGWSDGGNMRIDARWGGNDVSLTRKYAAELVGLAPNIVLASGTVSVEAVQQ